ncbi:MAG: hypothetical protein RIT81_19950 [Deltaproteobacteria bacterium]
MKNFLNLALVVGLALTGAACGSAIDCANICDEYSDCLDDGGQNIDVTECTNRCIDQADDNEPFQAAADDCSACLDQNEDMCVNCSQQCNVFLATVAASTE